MERKKVTVDLQAFIAAMSGAPKPTKELTQINIAVTDKETGEKVYVTLNKVGRHWQPELWPIL